MVFQRNNVSRIQFGFPDLHSSPLPNAAVAASSSQDWGVPSRDHHKEAGRKKLKDRSPKKWGRPKNKKGKIQASPSTSIPPSAIEQASVAFDRFSRNKLDAIVVTPSDEKVYFIPVGAVKEGGYVLVSKDEKGEFIKGTEDIELVTKLFSSKGEEDIESVTKKYLTSEGAEDRAKRYLTSEGAKFVQSVKKKYFPEGAKIEFVNAALFQEIKVLPPHQKERLMSRCFVDPETSPGISPGDVDASFKQLQEETAELNQDVDPQGIAQIIGASYVNNYPVIVDPKTKRLLTNTTINCDAWWSGSFLESNYTISIVADGCGLGQHSRDAAQRAVAAAKQYILEHLFEHHTLESLTQMVLTAFEKAHLECIKDDKTTTTLNVNLAFTAASGEEHRKYDQYLLVVGVGDTKSYLCTETIRGSPVVVDLSQYARFNFDATDSGGAIGGVKCDEENKYTIPNTDNLSVVCCKLDSTKDYVVLNMTDGVTDNCDPQFFGFSPCEVNDLIGGYDPNLEWTQIKRPSLRHKLITKFATELLAGFFSQYMLSGENLDGLCKRISDHCSKMTLAAREFMELNVKSKKPHTSKEYPGKLDHTTAVGFKIPSFSGSSTQKPETIFKDMLLNTSEMTF